MNIVQNKASQQYEIQVDGNILTKFQSFEDALAYKEDKTGKQRKISTRSLIEASKEAEPFSTPELSLRLHNHFNKVLSIMNMNEGYSKWLEFNCTRELELNGTHVPLRKKVEKPYHEVAVEEFDTLLASKWANSARIKAMIDKISDKAWTYQSEDAVSITKEINLGPIHLGVIWDKVHILNQNPMKADQVGKRFRIALVSKSPLLSVEGRMKDSEVAMKSILDGSTEIC